MKRIIKRFFIGFMISVFLLIFTLHFHSTWMGHRLDTQFSDTEIAEYDVVMVDGINVAYRAAGPLTGDVLVLVHGFLGSGYDYRDVMVDLAVEYRVIAIDMVGFGHSDKPIEFTYTPPHQAKILHQVLHELGISSYHLLGHSMGARVVVYHAQLYPDAGKSLVLLAPTGTEGHENGRTPPGLFYRYVFKNYTLQWFGFRGASYSQAYQTTSYFDPFYYFTKDIPIEVLQKMQHDVGVVDWDDVFTAVNVAVLIVVGTEDTWTPVAVAQHYEARLETSTMVLLPNTGHLPMLEAAESLTEHLRDFLDDSE